MAFDRFMEGIDISKYLKSIPEYITGRNRYNPVDMLKTVLFAFAENGYCSLRKLEDNCKVNMRYMYLMNWKTPSYRTFGYFVNEVLAESVEAIFQDINLAIFAQEKVDLSHLYIDGTKLEANANKYSWVWKKATEKSRLPAVCKNHGFAGRNQRGAQLERSAYGNQRGVCAGTSGRNAGRLREVLSVG